MVRQTLLEQDGRTLLTSQPFADLPFERHLSAICRTEDVMARLDERVSSHAAADGFRERLNFLEAVSAMKSAGELVHLEDLMLHDARMDAHTVTSSTITANSIVRLRRRLWEADARTMKNARAMRDFFWRTLHPSNGREVSTSPEDLDFAEIDALLARTSEIIATKSPVPPKQALPAQLSADHAEEDFARWHATLDPLDAYPPSVAAALLLEGWARMKPSSMSDWAGGIFASFYLRGRSKIVSHLFATFIGREAVAAAPWRSTNRTTRFLASLSALEAAAQKGLRELDKLSLAQEQLAARCMSSRSNSHLPQVAELALARPIVTTTTISAHVGITQRAALDAIADLNLRELTGRTRYRAWSI